MDMEKNAGDDMERSVNKETFPNLRDTIRQKRGNLCEACGIYPWTELHHCVVHDTKKLHKLVTVEENLMAVCRHCHPYLNGHAVRRLFVDIQRSRGYDIKGWYETLPLKYKEAWLME